MRASDIMTQPVHTVRDTDTIEDAAALLNKYAITAAPVLDGTDTLVGIVSEADLLWRVMPKAPSESTERMAGNGPRRPKVVAEVMSTHPLTTTPLTDVADIAMDMIHHDVRSVIRTDETLAQEIQHRLDQIVSLAGSASARQHASQRLRRRIQEGNLLTR